MTYDKDKIQEGFKRLISDARLKENKEKYDPKGQINLEEIFESKNNEV